MSFLQATSSLWHRPWGRWVLILVGIAFLYSVILTVQLMYPKDKTLPSAYLNGELVGGVLYDDLVRDITSSFEKSSIVVSSGSRSEELQLRHLGASLDADEMAQELMEYPLSQRFVPFSLYFTEPRINHFQVSISEEQLGESAETLSKKLSFKAEDATIDIVDGNVATKPAKPGYKVSQADIKEAVTDASFGFGITEVSVDGESQAPSLTDDDIEDLKDHILTVVNQPLVIVHSNDMQFRPGPRDIASWLAVSAGDDGGKPTIGVEQSQMTSYVAEINDKVGSNPGISKVSVVDGREISRSKASSGLKVDEKKLAADIEDVIVGGSGSVVVIDMMPVPPRESYSRQFTSSQKGLQAYVDYVTRTEDVRIAVSQTNGKRWSAYGRADEQTVAASTYKLYVAYMLFDQVRSGKLSWDDAMFGTDTAGCLERVIVVSDNPCAERFIKIFGGTNLNNFLYKSGISKNTTFISKVASQTTARDLNKFLVGLETSSMLKGSSRSNLLDKMGRQVYRRGIPAGSAGRVHDKVGFLWDYLNDAAVVYHPKGTYTLAIMTKKSSWERIAEITKELERIMYP